MRLNDEQNIAFMNDPRRIEAERKAYAIRDHIKRIQISDKQGLEIYIRLLPPLLRELEEAYQNLIVVEATVEAELLEKGA